MNASLTNFLNELEVIYSEWQTDGYCQEAAKLNRAVGETYFCTTNPHFFTGNPASAMVLVHLNPKRNKISSTKQYKLSTPAESGFRTFNDYLHYYQNFGAINYGKDSARTHRSPFDHKQIRFLRPFRLLDIDSADVYSNLQNVIDEKLQLELVPYGSPDFNYRHIGIENLMPFVSRLLSVITATERKYVIFCGAVFQPILEPYIQQHKSFRFKLPKKDGTSTINEFELINLRLKHESKIIHAAIAPQFAKQGYPVEAYGEKIKCLYGEMC